MITREKSFLFNGIKLIVKFPNVGQMLDIEALKQTLSGNKYGIMASSGVRSMYTALNIIDTFSFFEVTCPRLKAILDVKSLVELTTEDTKELVKVYLKDIAPWYKEAIDELYNIEFEGEKKESVEVKKSENVINELSDSVE